jgi:hypothetical protein
MLKDKQDQLDHFTGTEAYHRWSLLFPRMVLTDGAKFVADNGGTNGAYWLVDAIASYQPRLCKHRDDRLREIQFWTLKVTDDSAVLTCRADSDVPPVVTQRIEYTDFDLPEIDLWALPIGDGRWVIMLPSEH